MTRTVAVLGTRYRDLDVERGALEPLGVELVVGDGADADAIVAVARDAEVILAASRPRFGADVLERLRCRAIVRYGIGVDSIDLAAAHARGILVARESTYGTEAVATHALALALAGTRRLVAADRWVRDGHWGFDHLRPLHLPSASTAGIVGYGRIGRALAGMLSAIGFRVQVLDPVVTSLDPGHVRADDLATLLATSDVVSLHAPGNPDGSALIGAAELARMREGAVLVNTARGSLIDLDALVAALATGRPGVAALDVFPTEPVDASRFAPVADRVVLTPHTSWYTEESERTMRERTVAAAVAFLRGERPAEVVVDPSVPFTPVR